MTNDELKAAAAESKELPVNETAEALRRFRDPGLHASHYDYHLLAIAYAAMHPADDGEPVTEEWLAELAKQYGGRSCDQPVIATFRLSQEFDLQICQSVNQKYRTGLRCMRATPNGSAICNYCQIGYCSNRGEVRRLLEAMGINPKGGTP